MASAEDALRGLLSDPTYWRPRLERLAEVPRGLTQIPRDDLARPGIEVLELRLRAHDGVRLEALLARNAFYKECGGIHLRTCVDLESCALDFGAVEEGLCDVVFAFPVERRLEDRVLDVIRWVEAAASLQELDAGCVELYSGCQPAGQEFVIADLLRRRGLGGR